MCELFGFCGESAGRPDALLRSFAEHSARNPHGWGVACYSHGELVLRKMPETALSSKAYFEAVRDAEGKIIISHIRNASCGEIHERNCHPFRREQGGKQWAFAHNGHIDGISLHPRCGGETDSEAVFHMLMDRIGDFDDPYDRILGCIVSIFDDYEFGREVRLNFLLSDGEKLYAFSHHPEKPMYYTVRETAGGSSLMIATQALDTGEWAMLPDDRLVVVSHGKLLAMSDKL
jgi:predicted glutamine amidotransferase